MICFGQWVGWAARVGLGGSFKLLAKGKQWALAEDIVQEPLGKSYLKSLSRLDQIVRQICPRSISLHANRYERC